jgi:hypothetical protein
VFGHRPAIGKILTASVKILPENPAEAAQNLHTPWRQVGSVIATSNLGAIGVFTLYRPYRLD